MLSCFLNHPLSQIQYYLLWEIETRHWNIFMNIIVLLRGRVITNWNFAFADSGHIFTKKWCNSRSSGLTDIFPSKACICMCKSVQRVRSMVICFSSEIYWVVHTILCSALSGWESSSSHPLPQGHLTDTEWWGQSVLSPEPCTASASEGVHRQGLTLCPEMC